MMNKTEEKNLDPFSQFNVLISFILLAEMLS